MSILSLENITYAYKNNTDKQILKNINIEFNEGTFYTILGPSGSGKTTLLSLLAGLDEPNEGFVKFGNKDIAKAGYREHRKDHISLVFQNYNLIDYLTPVENLQLINKHANPNILLDLGLSEKDIHRNVLQLSGGQQQRVAIARALVSDAPIILADEPTGNLDEDTANEIVNILKRSAEKENKCVIVVTHDKQVAQQADVVLELSQQKLLEIYPIVEN